MAAQLPVQQKSSTCTYFLSYCLLAIFFISTALAAAQHPPTTGKSVLTANLINIEASRNKPFRYRATLYNGTSKTQIYDLSAQLPEGWKAEFKAQGNQVTSLKVESGKKENLSITLYASYHTSPKKYKIPISAIAANESLQLNLNAVVKGSYGVKVTTPTGRLSDEVTEGSEKKIQLIVKNIATLPLKDIKLSAHTPRQWNATFEPSKISKLGPGETNTVTATLKVPDKTIVGDYITKFSAKSANAHDDAAFRMTVVTSLLTGWIGVLVIIFVVAIVYFLVRKYGRR